VARLREHYTSPELAAALAVFLASEASGRSTGKLIAAPYDPAKTGPTSPMNSTPHPCTPFAAWTPLPSNR